MKRSLKELTGYSVKANDGIKGRVKDFLFDEEKWVIRYAEVDLGLIFPGRKVIIPNTFFENPDWKNQEFPIDLSKSDIESCPRLAEKLPVSRKYEEELNRHYKISSYWLPTSIDPAGTSAITYPPRPISIPLKRVNEKKLDTSLRSFLEIKGYHINAIDGKIGHIDDIIIDDIDWQVVYAVVDTSNWMPWSKKVLTSINLMDEISYEYQEIKIDLTVKAIKSAPEFDPSEPINEAYEKKLYDYIGRPVAQS